MDDYTFLDISGLTKPQEEKINNMLEKFKEENKGKSNNEEFNLFHMFGAESELEKISNLCQENKITSYDYNTKKGKCKMTFENEDGKEETVEYDI